jgi:hypothetical protein
MPWPAGRVSAASHPRRNRLSPSRGQYSFTRHRDIFEQRPRRPRTEDASEDLIGLAEGRQGMQPGVMALTGVGRFKSEHARVSASDQRANAEPPVGDSPQSQPSNWSPSAAFKATDRSLVRLLPRRKTSPRARTPFGGNDPNAASRPAPELQQKAAIVLLLTTTPLP